MSVQPAPIVVQPGGKFLGNDGSWSTFLIQVGDPPQPLHVLVASQVSSTWIVSPDGCSKSDASNCTAARGGTFDSTLSSAWLERAVYQLDAEANLGYSGNAINGTYGFDTLGIPGAAGVGTVAAEHQVIAAIITKAYFVGNLGLNAAQINFTGQTDSAPSFISSLRNEGRIPSRSFGYTAGASYQGKSGVNGSLTLGGYDASRFVPNDVEFTFAPTETRQLVATIQSIYYSDSKTETTLMSSGIMALVDTTVPFIWLPQTICQSFERAFGLTWDPIHNLYSVNDTLHSTLVKKNASISFELSNSGSGGPAVNITLPYASFDLLAIPPLISKPTRYFPLQRANDDQSYTLGRTFFQEAFLTVNFDNSTFTVSQAVHDSNAPTHIVAMETANTTSPLGPSGTVPITKTTPQKSGGGISSGAIAGIVVVIILVALAAVGGVWFYKIYSKNRRLKAEAELSVEGPGGEKDMQEDYSKDSPVEPEGGPSDKPIPTFTEGETHDHMSSPLSEADGDNYFSAPGSDRKPAELPGSHPRPSELHTPPLSHTSELGSAAEHQRMLRSELTTPDPSYLNTELPGHEVPRHEMYSPDLNTIGHAAAADAMSTGSMSDGNLSPRSSQFPIQSNPRPSSYHASSSDSAEIFNREASSTGNNQSTYRSRSLRSGSGDSDVSAMSPTMSPITPNFNAFRHPNSRLQRPGGPPRLNSEDSIGRVLSQSDGEGDASPRGNIDAQAGFYNHEADSMDEGIQRRETRPSEKAEGKRKSVT